MAGSAVEVMVVVIEGGGGVGGGSRSQVCLGLAGTETAGGIGCCTGGGCVDSGDTVDM